MPITTTNMGKKLFLSLLLAFATAIPQNAQAISTVGNRDYPASFQGIERSLAYVPYEKGTVVRFDDQDGAWMLGVIYDYDSSTQTYTIQWAEDSLNEDFSDLSKVENMINSAKENSNTIDKVSGGERLEGFQFPYHYPYDDLSEYQAWPNGTPVLLEFADGWFMGEITEFTMSDDKKGATYIVTWSDGALDTFFNELEWVDLMVANAVDYQPWETGTPTYGYGQEPFLSGEIINFNRGVYSITWSNGDIVTYYDFDLIDTFVTAAANNIDSSWIDNYNPWPMNTGVMWIFDNGFVDGNITGFARGTYTIMWSDSSVKLYSNLEKVDQMVAFYNGVGYIGKLATPSASDYMEVDHVYDTYYALETVVYAEFKDGWWAGYIDSYDNEYYVIRWSDNSVDKFLPGEAMDDMVRNAKNIPADYAIWEVGTRVHQKYEGTWYWGSIETSNAGFYTILWDDGSRSTYVSGPEMEQIVKNAYKRGFSFGNIAIALIAFGCAGFVGFFAFDKNRKKLAAFREQVRANELGFSDNTGYQDEEPGARLPRVV